MSERPKIKSVTITVEIGGKDRLYTYTPDQVTAIFFDWNTIEKILIPFYKNNSANPVKITKTQTKKEFGKNVMKKFFKETDPDDATVPIDENFLTTAWKTPNNKDILQPYLTKRPACTSGGEPDDDGIG